MIIQQHSSNLVSYTIVPNTGAIFWTCIGIGARHWLYASTVDAALRLHLLNFVLRSPGVGAKMDMQYSHFTVKRSQSLT